MRGYPDSYYAATATTEHEHASLTEILRADVCVIGGGFTGLSAALNLAEQGLNVVLLEAERIGYGASGRCGGLIGSGQRWDAVEMEDKFGLATARRFWEFAEAAKTEIRERVAQHGAAGVEPARADAEQRDAARVQQAANACERARRLDGGTRVVQHEEYRGLGVWFWDASWVEPAYSKANEALRDRVAQLKER